MDGLVREVVILVTFCVVWTFLTSPRVAESLHKMQWTNKPAGDEDYVARSRFSRCGVYALCASIPFGSHVQYPLNLLAVTLVFPAVFALSWVVHKKFERKETEEECTKSRH